MKDLGPAIVWGLNRIGKVFGNIFSLIIRCFTKVHKGRMMCWAYTFKQYSCNPRYLTEYLLENNTEFEIFWVFRGNVDTADKMCALQVPPVLYSRKHCRILHNKRQNRPLQNILAQKKRAEIRHVMAWRRSP